MTGIRSCEREDAVRDAVRRAARRMGGAAGRDAGVDDDALRAHLVDCPACRETVAVTVWMQDLAGASVPSAKLPDPALLWWKADLMRRWDAQRRAAAPLERAEPWQAGVGLIGAVLLFVWLWDRQPAGASPGASVWGLVDSVPTLLVATAGCVLLLAVLTVVTFRDVVRDY